jgi:hypothetical protein
MATSVQEANYILEFNKAKCVKRVKRRHRTEFGVDPPSKPCSYVTYRQLFETRCLYKEKDPFAPEYMDGTGIPT